MSITGVGLNQVTSQISAASSYFTERNSDARQLAQALKSGDLDGAQQAYDSLASLGSLPGSNSTTGAPFSNPSLVSDFQSIGQALQSGNLSGAQQAFQTLQNDFRSSHPVVSPDTVAKVSAAGSQGATAGGVNLIA